MLKSLSLIAVFCAAIVFSSAADAQSNKRGGSYGGGSQSRQSTSGSSSRQSSNGSVARTTSTQEVSRTNNRAQQQAEYEGVAVVELFTSQGCSSCPSADEVLMKVAKEASESELPVFVLSFHVDYWNNLGWTDPYSTELYTKRQRAYASAMNSERVYTPQMIVNGTTEFVGSKQTKAYQAINRSLKKKFAAEIRGKINIDEATSQISLDYSLDGKTKGRILNVAVVETPNANSVPRGENAGRELQHVNVVRAFKANPIEEDSGTVTLEIPEGLEATDLQVIAYVQDPKTLSIVGATAIN